MATRTRKQPAAAARKNAELEQEYERTKQRLVNLQKERAELEQTLRLNNDAQHQILGRARFIEEQLGLAPPMDPPAEPAPEPDGDLEEIGKQVA